MKWLKILATLTVTVILIVVGASCKGGSAQNSNTTSITATVQKGTISNTVTGTGNLALSNTEDLAFEVAGTVQEIMVEAGQTVTKDQELVRLDTSDWDNQIKSLQKAVSNAERSLTTATSNVAKAQNQIEAKQLAARQAELDFQTTENNVNQIADVQKAQNAIDDASYDLKFAQSIVQASAVDPGAGYDTNYWNQQVIYLKAELAQKQKDLQEILGGTSLKVTSDVALQVAKTQLQVEQSQMALDNAQAAIQDARTSLANAQADEQDARQAVADAQANLDNANNLSPVIKAPFDGFVTRINVSGGQAVQKGTIGLQIADPDQFEANIMVTEQDIFSVKVDGEASVAIDALSSLAFPAKVTKIAPLATVQQGVVNYKVTVQMTSTRPSLPNLGGTGQNFSQSFPSGTRPSGVPTSLPNGSPLPTNLPQSTSGASQSDGSSFQRFGGNMAAAAGALQNFTLKDGLSATVDVIIQQKQDVLVVPSRAITQQGRNSIVKVVTGDTTEDRVIQTGLSDSTNTEVIQGLTEGEQIMIQVTSSSTSSTQGNQLFPGGGGGQFRLVVPR